MKNSSDTIVRVAEKDAGLNEQGWDSDEQNAGVLVTVNRIPLRAMKRDEITVRNDVHVDISNERRRY